MLSDWIIEYIGEWVLDYPHIYGGIILILLIVIFSVMENFIYWLTRFISGER